jgi:outer membrane immunogenic protein
MKRLALALTAIAAFTAPALAADMAARPYAKAPAPVAAVASWTGFWISGGFGYGMSQYQHSEYNIAAPFALVSTGQDVGAKGWLGKVGLGYDYQFAGPYGSWVVGAFADTDWSNISGQYTIATARANLTGQYRSDYSWSVGGRVGYVALPGLLTYFNGGYTQAHSKGTGFLNTTNPTAPVVNAVALAGQTRDGYFLGGGTEYAVSVLPGLFWKNEVRFSSFNNRTDTAVCTAAVGCAVGPTFTQTSRLYEQKATTELVYRFNWGGPVVAKY